LSTIVLLPIVETGGSNLKTAEAILSGKIVIATSIALRGYEEFKDEPYIIIANTPDDFKSAIKKCLRKDFSYTFSSDRTGEKYKKLLWNHSLENIPTTVLKLTKKQ
jgi:glycosyltransferase involved in cell wall biosynthesis